MNAQKLYTDLLSGMRSLIGTYEQTPRLVGIASGGVWLAQRLHKDLKLNDDIGVLSSSMHRDDFSQRGLTLSEQTKLPFDVNGTHLIVLDDVLYTGRTLRAVLNELFDYGRPASVKLVVLVDRSGRQLPIQADFAATKITLPASQSLSLACDEAGMFSFQIRELA